MTRIPSLGNIDAFVKAVQKFPMMTREEETAIGKEPQGEGRDRLITSHLRLCVSNARDYIWIGIPFEDLISAAVIGLFKAVDKFDPEKGMFHNIAISYIKMELNEYAIRNHRMVKIATTHGQRKLWFNLHRMKYEMLAGTGSNTLSIAQMEQIAEKLNVRLDEVQEMEFRLAGGEFSMSPNDDDDEDGRTFRFDELLGSEDSEPSHMIREMGREWLMVEGIREALDVLNERERSIIQLRHMDENALTLHEVGAIHGISAERVRQIEVKAMQKLRVELAEFA